MNSKDQDSVVDSANSPANHLTKHSEVLGESKPAQQTTQPQQHKKQVRRRLQTSRPYKERLVNMAEARREIVTALKYHRAAMKQASEDRQQQSQDQQQTLSYPIDLPRQPYFEQDGRLKFGRNLRTYPSNTTDFSNHMDCYSFSSFNQTPTPASNPFWWSSSPTAPPLHPENPNFVLPDQTLGLNLNFHDFTNLEANPYHNSNNTSRHLGSSPSSTSSSPLSIATDQEAPLVAISPGERLLSPAPMDTSLGPENLHAAMDDEIAEFKSIGEQHQMEWNDTMNLVTSARWFKFLKIMELGTPEVMVEENDSYDVFEVMEFPSWLNANDSFLEQCSEEYFQDPILPCMDMEDIESIEGDWWA